MLRALTGTQRLERIMGFRVDGTTATSALLEGGFDAVISEPSADAGDYLITFNEKFVRTPIVKAGCLTAACNVQIFSVSTSAVRVKVFAVDGTTPKDADFHLLVLGFDTANIS